MILCFLIDIFRDNIDILSYLSKSFKKSVYSNEGFTYSNRTIDAEVCLHQTWTLKEITLSPIVNYYQNSILLQKSLGNC